MTKRICIIVGVIIMLIGLGGGVWLSFALHTTIYSAIGCAFIISGAIIIGKACNSDID